MKYRPPKNLNLLVAGLIAGLNFDKIAKVMNHLEWSYDGSLDAPSVSVLKTTATECLEDMLKKGDLRQAVGGFETWRDGKEFGIRFVITSSATLDFDEEKGG
jgi:hypothetical protein